MKILLKLFLFALLLVPSTVFAREITSVEPSEFTLNDVVTIKGSGFGSGEAIDEYLDGVWFDAPNTFLYIKAEDYISWTDNEIKFTFDNVKVPLKNTELHIHIFVEPITIYGVQTTEISILPYIADICKNALCSIKDGLKGETLEIQGSYFGSETGKVLFGENEAEITSWTNEKIICVIPELTEGADNIKIVNSYNKSSKDYVFSVDPTNVEIDEETPNEDSEETDTPQEIINPVEEPSPIEEIPFFTDVLTDNAFYTAIDDLKAKEIINGYSDGTFKPESLVNRVEACKFFLNGAGIEFVEGKAGENPFLDTVGDDWYSDCLRVAEANNIIKGYEDGTFRPTNPINGAEALKIFLEAKKFVIPEAEGDWYQKYLDFAIEQNIVDENFDVNQNLTRGVLADIIYRANS